MYKQAIQNYNKAIDLKPNRTTVLNNMAWLMAAIDEVSIQDANRAIELAGRACELTGYKISKFLDTLAVAYAAAGRFEDAVKTANKAVDIAKAGNQTDLVNEIQRRIKLYEGGQPYHQK